LTNELGCNPGSRTSALLAFSERDLKGRIAVCVACFVDPSGKATILLDGPIMGKFSSGRTKLHVVPESTTMVEAFRWKGLCLPMHWYIHDIIVDRRSLCTCVLLVLLMVFCFHHHHFHLRAGPSNLHCSSKCNFDLLYLLFAATLTLLKAPRTFRCSCSSSISSQQDDWLHWPEAPSTGHAFCA
jgi:hypothetical protein